MFLKTSFSISVLLNENGNKSLILNLKFYVFGQISKSAEGLISATRTQPNNMNVQLRFIQNLLISLSRTYT